MMGLGEKLMRKEKNAAQSAPSQAKRLLAGVLAAAVLAVLLCSVFYMAAEADHACIGEDCPICACIQWLEQTAERLGQGATGPLAASLLILLALSVSLLCSFDGPRETPARQRVRMNN